MPAQAIAMVRRRVVRARDGTISWLTSSRVEGAMLPKQKKGNPVDPEDLVDEALEETFPASDPISPGVGPGEPMPNPGDDRPRKPATKRR
jgi:hypothetical protein